MCSDKAGRGHFCCVCVCATTHRWSVNCLHTTEQLNLNLYQKQTVFVLDILLLWIESNKVGIPAHVWKRHLLATRCIYVYLSCLAEPRTNCQLSGHIPKVTIQSWSFWSALIKKVKFQAFYLIAKSYCRVQKKQKYTFSQLSFVPPLCYLCLREENLNMAVRSFCCQVKDHLKIEQNWMPPKRIDR